MADFTFLTKGNAPFLTTDGEDELERAKQGEEQEPENCDVVEELGYGNGFYSPFANEENHELEIELEQNELKVLQLVREYDHLEAYVEEMNLQEKNIMTDIRFAQDMAEAKTKHMEQTVTIFHQSRRDLKFMNVENERMTAFLDEITARNRTRLKHMEARERNYVQDMLDIADDSKWARFYRDNLNDMEAAMDTVYNLIDEDKESLKKLHMEMGNLELANREARKIIEHQSLVTKQTNEQYYRLVYEFREAHRKRKEILFLWSQSVIGVRSRDEELQQLAEEYCEALELLSKQLSTCECLQNYLRDKINDMEEDEHRLKYFELEGRKMDLLIEKLKSYVLAFKTDHVHLASVIEKMTYNRHDNRAKEQMIKKEFETVFDREEALRQQVELLRSQRNEIKSMACKNENITMDLEKMIETEESNYSKLDVRGGLIRKYIYERGIQKVELERELKEIQTRTGVAERLYRNLATKEYDNLSVIAKKQNRLYRADLEISQLEIQISRILNATVEPRFFKLQQRGENLRTANRYVSSTNVFLQKEAERLYTNRLMMIDDIETGRATTVQVEKDVADAHVTCQAAQRLYDALEEEVKQFKCQSTLLGLTISRMRQALVISGGKSYTMGQLEGVIRTAAAERKAEIDFRTEICNKRLHHLKLDLLGIRNCRIETRDFLKRLKLTFANLNGGSLTVDVGKKRDEERRTMMARMKAIYQERSILKRKQRILKRKINKMTAELEAMENVIEVTRCSNNFFKYNMHPGLHENDPVSEYENMIHAQNKTNVFRNRCAKLVENLKISANELLEQVGLLKDHARFAAVKANAKMIKVSEYKSELQHLRDRIDRWGQLLARVSQDDKTWHVEGIMKVVEPDIKFQMLQEKFELATRKLLELLGEDPEIRKATHVFLKQTGNFSQFVELNRD